MGYRILLLKTDGCFILEQIQKYGKNGIESPEVNNIIGIPKIFIFFLLDNGLPVILIQTEKL